MQALLATHPGAGALSAFWIEGTESELATLDHALAGSSAINGLRPGQARHGRLVARGQVVDEVILACPRAGIRVLTGHGGGVTQRALGQALEALGASLCNASLACSPWDAETRGLAHEADLALAQCRTETQAAFILRARYSLADRIARARQDGDEALARVLADATFARNLLRTHVVHLTGRANTGKSALFNAVVGQDQALVHAEPGTTRDANHAHVDVGGHDVHLVDGPCPVDSPDVVCVVVDGSAPLSADDVSSLSRLLESRLAFVAVSKIAPDDEPTLTRVRATVRASGASPRPVSPATGAAFRTTLAMLLGGPWNGEPMPFTERQVEAIAALRQDL